MSEASAAPSPETADTVTLSGRPCCEKGALRKAFGTIGAGALALIGRCTLLPGAGLSLGIAAGSLLGPVGAVVGGLAGLAAGAYVEMRGKFQGIVPVGRIVGGTIGGAVGETLGAAAEKLRLPIHLPDALVKETKGYSFGKLLSRVGDVAYTSHKLISREEADKIIALLKPGDILLTNHDVYMDFEIPERLLLGAKGGWTHGAVYMGDGKTMESLVRTKGVITRDVRTLIEEDHHVMVLRPKYRDPGDAQKVVEAARKFADAKYDFKFSLESDDKLYCTELVYKAVKNGAPYVNVEPWSILGKKIVPPDSFFQSKDFDVIYNTGSNFWLNYLSKFD
jgi:uncharacterized protein YycO